MILEEVALRKESVDRNILIIRQHSKPDGVALRKESVDRNVVLLSKGEVDSKSLSARRAWIEMPKQLDRPPPLTVALRKESVDRNIRVDKTQSAPRMSLSARRAWIEIPTGRK